MVPPDFQNLNNFLFSLSPCLDLQCFSIYNIQVEDITFLFHFFFNVELESRKKNSYEELGGNCKDLQTEGLKKEKKKNPKPKEITKSVMRRTVENTVNVTQNIKVMSCTKYLSVMIHFIVMTTQKN